MSSTSSTEALIVSNFYSDFVGETLPVAQLLVSIAQHCGNDDLKLECLQRSRAVYSAGKRVRDFLVEQHCIPPSDVEAIQRDAIHSFNAHGKPDVAALAFLEINNVLEQMVGREQQYSERIQILEESAALNTTSVRETPELLQDDRTCTNTSTRAKGTAPVFSQKAEVSAIVPTAFTSELPPTDVEKSNAFLSRLWKQLHRSGISGHAFSCGYAPLVNGTIRNIVSNIRDMIGLDLEFAKLSDALRMNQDLRKQLMIIDQKEYEATNRQASSEIDYDASYGVIASQADEKVFDVGTRMTESAAIVEAAERELNQVLFPQKSFKDADSERLWMRGKLREHIKERRDVKAFVSSISKLGAADYMHRRAIVGDVLVGQDLEKANHLFLQLSNDASGDGVKSVSIFDFKLILRQARASPDDEISRDGVHLSLSVLIKIRELNNDDVDLLGCWRDAQNFNPRDQKVTHWTTEKGHFVNNVDLRRDGNQSRNINIAVRLLILQEFADMIEPIFAGIGLEISNFAELLLHLTPTDVKQHCGVFEQLDFYTTDPSKLPEKTKDKLKYLVKQAIKKREAFCKHVQFVYLSRNEEAEGEGLFEIFGGANGLLQAFC